MYFIFHLLSNLVAFPYVNNKEEEKFLTFNSKQTHHTTHAEYLKTNKTFTVWCLLLKNYRHLGTLLGVSPHDKSPNNMLLVIVWGGGGRFEFKWQFKCLICGEYELGWWGVDQRGNSVGGLCRVLLVITKDEDYFEKLSTNRENFFNLFSKWWSKEQSF